MNHILAQQKEIAGLKAEVEGLREGLRDLLIYVNSPKFHSEPHVSTADIVLRVREIESHGTHKRDEGESDWQSARVQRLKELGHDAADFDN